MRINDKETLALTDAVKSAMAENAKDYKPNRGGTGHDDFIDLHSIDKEKRRGSSPLTEKDIEEANEFTKAAAKAAVAGDKEFEFDGKTYPAEMDVDVAKKILGESVSVNEAKSNKERQDAIADVIAKHPNRSLADYERMLFKNAAFKNKKFTKDEIRMLSKVQRDKKGNIAGMGKSPYPAIYNSTDLDEAVVYQQNLPQTLKKVETYLEFIEKALSVGSRTNKMVNRDLGGNYNKEFKKMEDALGVIFSEMDEIAMGYAMSESVELDESANDIAKKVKQLKVGDKTNFGVVTAISNKSITFKAKDTPKTEISFNQRKIGSRDFILDKLVKLTPDGKSVAKESAELEEAKFWTVTITKKTGKLFKGQTVDVKANNSAQAIEKGLKQMKVNPKLVPSNAVDATLAEEVSINIELDENVNIDHLSENEINEFLSEAKGKKASQIKTGDMFIANIARKPNAWSEPTPVTATMDAEETIYDKKLVSIHVSFKPKRGRERHTKIALPKSKVVDIKEANLEEANIEEASNADLKKVLATAKKIGGRVKGNTADFGMGAVIDFSIEKGKIKFDGGKSSGVEYFDNVKDAIASLTAGLD